MAIKRRSILIFSLIFIFLWSVMLIGSVMAEIIPFSTTDKEFYYNASLSVFAAVSVVIYIITLFMFIGFIRKTESTTRESLLKIASIILFVICLLLIAYYLLNGVIAFIHYLGLVNYSDFEQYQYYIDFVRIMFSVIYGGLVTYYIIKMKSEMKKLYYLYVISFWVTSLLPYLGSNAGLLLDSWIKEGLIIIEIVSIIVIVIISKKNIAES